MLRTPWGRFARIGYPPLVVKRPDPISDLQAGDPYPLDPADKKAMVRARRMYEQGRIVAAPVEPISPAPPVRKGKKHGIH